MARIGRLSDSLAAAPIRPRTTAVARDRTDSSIVLIVPSRSTGPKPYKNTRVSFEVFRKAATNCGMARILASKNNLLKPGHALVVHRNIHEGATWRALDARRSRRYLFVSGWRARGRRREFASLRSLFR